jgi:ABC-type branched-subunit amino acid transport system substrate-binding protein
LHQAGVPLMFANTTASAALTDTESTFNLTDPYFAQVNLQIQQAKDAGISKVTAIVIDVPTAVSLYTDVLPELYDEAGIELAVVPIAPGTADMTPQMQSVVAGGPTTVSIVGSDAFCIAALNGLQAVGYDGPVAAVSVCVTDALRTAVPGDVLDGVVIGATAPVGTDNPSTRLLGAVAETYGGDYDVNRPGTMSMFMVVAAFQAAANGVTGDITPASIIAAIKAAPEQDLPGASGLRFRCNGKAVPSQPAVCVRGGLTDEGRPAEFVATGVSAIED